MGDIAEEIVSREEIGAFELNKLGWFTVELVEPNAFLNDKLDSDQYGIYYSVKFQGDATSHLWRAKTAPEEGMKVYGHLELSKSGKSTVFRRAKKEDTLNDGTITYVEGGSTEKKTWKPPSEKKEWKSDEEFWSEKDSLIKAQWAIGQAVQLVNSGTERRGDKAIELAIEDWAKEFFSMVDRVKQGSQASITSGVPAKEPAPVKDGDYESMVKAGYGADEINLEDIPF